MTGRKIPNAGDGKSPIELIFQASSEGIWRNWRTMVSMSGVR
jgi:hypothetical protein